MPPMRHVCTIVKFFGFKDKTNSRAMSHTRGQKPESAASPQVRVEPAAEMHTSIRHEKPAVSRRRLLSLATPPGSPKQVLRSFDLRYFSFLAPSIFELATM